MKNLIISCVCAASMCSCLQNYKLMDEVAQADYGVCTGACIISTAIREDITGEKRKAFEDVSKLLKVIIDNDEISRSELESQLTAALSKVFSDMLTTAVVGDIMAVYDENMTKIHENGLLMSTLEATKSAVDSGIILADSDCRPVKVVPFKY